jgi:hypothetical protein
MTRRVRVLGLDRLPHFSAAGGSREDSNTLRAIPRAKFRRSQKEPSNRLAGRGSCVRLRPTWSLSVWPMAEDPLTADGIGIYFVLDLD